MNPGYPYNEGKEVDGYCDVFLQQSTIPQYKDMNLNYKCMGECHKYYAEQDNGQKSLQYVIPFMSFRDR